MLLALLLSLGQALDSAALVRQAEGLARKGWHEQALAAYDAAAKLVPNDAALRDRRGDVRLFQGRFKEAVEDFDAHLAKQPGDGPHHWRRGIACYYAGQHEAGKKQFEDHATVNAADVENVAWWWLCAAKTMGLEKASAAIPEVGFDRRVPLPAIDKLYRGQAKPADVEAAIQQGDPTGPELRARRFYGHLYLGLWHDARGETAEAKKHLEQAAVRHWLPGYMGEIARTHLQFLESRGRKPANAAKPAAPNPDKYKKEFAAFAADDAAKPFAPGGVVFVGSSTIRLWKLADTFPGLPALNRGFGGSTAPDVLPQMELLVWKHQPRAVVYYEGDNDIASGATPEAFAANAGKFLTDTLAKTQAKIVVLGIKPSIRRWQQLETQRRANALVQKLCEGNPRMAFLDPADDVLGPDGRPVPECFLNDGLHLSPEGYRRLAARLKPLLGM